MMHTQVTVALISIFVGCNVIGPMTKKFGIRKTLMFSLAIGRPILVSAVGRAWQNLSRWTRRAGFVRRR